MLLLHRPFLADSASNAFAVCCSASSSMANLLKLYKRLYSFRRMSSVGVHQIFTAATTLVYIFHKSEEQQAAGIPLSDPNLLETTRSSLLTCLAALSALATRQVHARRSYLSVILLMKKWRVSLEVLETQKRREYYDQFVHSRLTTPCYYSYCYFLGCYDASITAVRSSQP